jgi:hypothetical protein
VRPRFGTLTRILSAVFFIAGVGAAFAALSSGHQITPGARWDDPILLGLALGYAVVGIGLLIERVWAWWAGAAIAAFTVVMSLALGSPDTGWVLWVVFLVLFGVTGAQGRRDRHVQRDLLEPHQPDA